ncbi:MAG: S41 family peptidase [Anaerovoracaceae bacterium]|jgi:carboxyl-terminal processing protease|nr:S41 family peptidase [Anaerovoracaceae bacterium]
MIAIRKKKFILLIMVALILGFALAGGIGAIFLLTNDSVILSDRQYQTMKYMTEKYDKTEQLYTAIQDNYYIGVEDDPLLEGIYKGLLWGLNDPYSEYLTSREYEDLMVSTMGEFEGIGVTITADTNGNIVVVSTIEGTPADQAGLKTGDVITMVDKEPYNGSQLSKAAGAMRGEKGTRVTITYWREGVTTDVVLTRAKIVDKSIYSKMLTEDLAYIRITQFEKNTDKDFQLTLNQLEESGVKGIIIDLRNNGGGLIDSGINIADMLLGEGTITYLENNKKERNYYNSEDSATTIPYILLINEGTASTSEILAAAIQDNRGGRIIGTKSFGKGVVQSVEMLADGDALKLTVMQYYSPKGNIIQGKGVTPDVIVEDIEETPLDEPLEKAIQLLQ